jgi:polyisoprenoid-binding protein YceI
MKTPLYVAIALALGACAKQEPPAIVDAQEAAPATTATTSAPLDVPAGAYTTDDAHSSLLFRVVHLGFSNYTGRFKSFDTQLQFDPANLAASSVEVSVDPNSLDVEHPPEGFLAELLGAQFLDAGQFPELTYRSTAVESTGPNTVKITGDLTLHGVTHPVVLNATLNGGYAGHPMDPNARIGFSARGTLKRSDFGISYGIPAPGTTLGVSDEVEVIVETELTGPNWTPSADEAATQS